MTVKRHVSIGLVIVGLLAVTTAPASAATTLKGTVGPGFTITLTKSGKKITSLKAGAYKIIVKDRSTAHNFVLTGPGITKNITTVRSTGTKTVTVRLKKGTYTYYCTPHMSIMTGSFKVS